MRKDASGGIFDVCSVFGYWLIIFFSHEWCVRVVSNGYRFLTGVRSVFVILSGKCGESGVDSLVWDFHYIQTRGVGWAWWVEIPISLDF